MSIQPYDIVAGQPSAVHAGVRFEVGDSDPSFKANSARHGAVPTFSADNELPCGVMSLYFTPDDASLRFPENHRNFANVVLSEEELGDVVSNLTGFRRFRFHKDLDLPDEFGEVMALPTPAFRMIIDGAERLNSGPENGYDALWRVKLTGIRYLSPGQLLDGVGPEFRTLPHPCFHVHDVSSPLGLAPEKMSNGSYKHIVVYARLILHDDDIADFITKKGLV